MSLVAEDLAPAAKAVRRKTADKPRAPMVVPSIDLSSLVVTSDELPLALDDDDNTGDEPGPGRVNTRSSSVGGMYLFGGDAVSVGPYKVPDPAEVRSTLLASGRSATARRVQDTAIMHVVAALLHADSGSGLPTTPMSRTVHDLIYFSWAHDQHLLVSSGKRRSPLPPYQIIDSPPCIWGRRCVMARKDLGITECVPVDSGIEYPGIPFMSMMTPTELYIHLTTGVAPENRRDCLMCFRYMISRLVVILDTTDKLDVLANVCVGPFFNKHGPGEYLSECLHMVGAKRGLQAPVAIFNINNIYLQLIDPVWGTWIADQRMMRQQPLEKSIAMGNTSDSFR